MHASCLLNICTPQAALTIFFLRKRIVCCPRLSWSSINTSAYFPLPFLACQPGLGPGFLCVSLLFKHAQGNDLECAVSCGPFRGSMQFFHWFFFCCLPYELTSDDVSIARMPSVPWSEPCAASTLFFLCLIPFVIVDRCLLDNSNVDGVAGVSE
jgi:hypothetical protein